MKVTVFIPTYNRTDTLVKLIHSINSGTLLPNRIVVYDHHPDRLTFMALPHYNNLEVIYNDGNVLSAAWNYALDTYKDFTIISNDDILVEKDTIEKFVDFAKNNKYGFLVAQSGANAWSFFLQRHWLFREIGPYDENFIPAYFEDNDYHYRMKLRGYDYLSVPDATVQHQNGGSSTIQLMSTEDQQRMSRQFRKNQLYYQGKWGGLPGQEIYDKPFNGILESDTA